MNKLTSVLLSLCLVAAVQNVAAMEDHAMSKDAMKKDSMSHDAMSKDSMGHEAMSKDGMDKDAMEKKDSMPTRRDFGHCSIRAPMNVSATARAIAEGSRP